MYVYVPTCTQTHVCREVKMCVYEQLSRSYTYTRMFVYELYSVQTNLVYVRIQTHLFLFSNHNTFVYEHYCSYTNNIRVCIQTQVCSHTHITLVCIRTINVCIRTLTKFVNKQIEMYVYKQHCSYTNNLSTYSNNCSTYQLTHEQCCLYTNICVRIQTRIVRIQTSFYI